MFTSQEISSLRELASKLRVGVILSLAESVPLVKPPLISRIFLMAKTLSSSTLLNMHMDCMHDTFE